MHGLRGAGRAPASCAAGARRRKAARRASRSARCGSARSASLTAAVPAADAHPRHQGGEDLLPRHQPVVAAHPARSRWWSCTSTTSASCRCRAARWSRSTSRTSSPSSTSPWRPSSSPRWRCASSSRRSAWRGARSGSLKGGAAAGAPPVVGKFWVGVVPLLVFGEVLVLATNSYLQVMPFMMWLSAGTLVRHGRSRSSRSALAVGAAYPELRRRQRRQGRRRRRRPGLHDPVHVVHRRRRRARGLAGVRDLLEPLHAACRCAPATQASVVASFAAVVALIVAVVRACSIRQRHPPARGDRALTCGVAHGAGCRRAPSAQRGLSCTASGATRERIAASAPRRGSHAIVARRSPPLRA